MEPEHILKNLIRKILRNESYKKALIVIVIVFASLVAIVAIGIYLATRFAPSLLNTVSQELNQNQNIITNVTDTISNTVSNTLPQINILTEKQKQLNDTVNSARQLLNIGGGN